jgi:hypothetical protein
MGREGRMLISHPPWMYGLFAAALAYVGSTKPQDADAATVEEPAGKRVAAARGTNLNGKDPYATGCARDGRPVQEFTLPDGKLELIYSRACGTNWAQLTRNGKYSNDAWVEGKDGAGRNETMDTQLSRWMYSNMWYAPDSAMRACANVTDCTGDCDTSTLYCTDYR